MALAEEASPTARFTHPPNDRREIFGWMLYDWANSTFSTTVAGALLGPYLTALAQSSVGDNGVVMSLGPLGVITATSFFPFCISASVFLQVFLLPILGAVADYTSLKKRLMMLFCYVGVAATCLLFFITGGLFLLGGLLFIVGNLAFGAAIVLYNSYLGDITSEDQRDKVSSRGFAAGYLGGGILLALNFGLLVAATNGLVPFDAGTAVRISLLSAGLWWGAFALAAFARLRTRPAGRILPRGQSMLTVGFSEVLGTFRELGRLPHTLRYLAAYLFYNDGIQTVIGLSSVFLAQELFTPAERESGTAAAFALQIFLLVQFVAFGGALLFERISRLVGTKCAIMISLAIWAGIVIYAYASLSTRAEAWGMAVVLALVLGGSQALSRALFSRMIPQGREASFFGVYEVSERGTSWIGPAIFGVVVSSTGSYRQAILSLIVLFLAGLLILALTNTDQAIRDAGNGTSGER